MNSIRTTSTPTSAHTPVSTPAASPAPSPNNRGDATIASAVAPILALVGTPAPSPTNSRGINAINLSIEIEDNDAPQIVTVPYVLPQPVPPQTQLLPNRPNLAQRFVARQIYAEVNSFVADRGLGEASFIRQPHLPPRPSQFNRARNAPAG